MALNDVEHCEACQIHEDVVKAVTDHMPDEDQLYDLAEVFKVFGDSTRIFYSLADSHVKTIISQGMEHIQE